MALNMDKTHSNGNTTLLPTNNITIKQKDKKETNIFDGQAHILPD